MEYVYYLTDCPLRDGAYPTENLTKTEPSDQRLRDGRRLTGRLEYSKPLPRHDETAYGLTPLPLVQVFVSILPDLATDAYLPGDECGTLRGLIEDFDWYQPIEDAEFVTIKDAQGEDRRVTKTAVRECVELLPGWSRPMFQYLLQGCPSSRFRGLDPDAVSTEGRRVEAEGAYGLMF